MKKICCMVWASTVNGLTYAALSPMYFLNDYSDLKNYLSKDYEVSTNYLKDKNNVDYLVVPDPFAPFDNENNLPIIKVPAKFFITKDFQKIKEYIDTYISKNKQK